VILVHFFLYIRMRPRNMCTKIYSFSTIMCGIFIPLQFYLKRREVRRSRLAAWWGWREESPNTLPGTLTGTGFYCLAVWSSNGTMGLSSWVNPEIRSELTGLHPAHPDLEYSIFCNLMKGFCRPWLFISTIIGCNFETCAIKMRDSCTKLTERLAQDFMEQEGSLPLSQ
jgi:hypothetical protein